MPIIKPEVLDRMEMNSQEQSLQHLPINSIQRVLQANLPALKAAENNDHGILVQQLEEQGGGLDKVAGTICELMNFSSEEHIRLQAARTILEARGLSKRAEAVGAPTFNFIIKGDNVDINGILAPTRD